MKNNKIIFIKGLWSHPEAVLWVKNQLEKTTNIPVELFDYHDILIENINNEVYLKRVIEKYSDLYSSSIKSTILLGHSHGGAISLVLSEKLKHEKIIIANPAFRPWGIIRRVPHELKNTFAKFNIGESYKPHFTIKYDEEVEERKKYFTKNFKLSRDLSRINYVGTKALDTLHTLRSSLLLIQSMKDEFISVSTSLKYYNNLSLPEYKKSNNKPYKDLMIIENGEHAILEEEEIYPLIYRKIDAFIKRK